MSNLMSTSQWIGFFRKAGLPANVAANYAIIFSDNRIQLDMLLDLSKEYLYDMGIKVMGDVIGILKFAKEFHNQLVKEKMIGNTTQQPSTPNNNKAVAERMVGRYTRPLVAPPVRSPAGQAQRGLKQKSNVISLKRKSDDFVEEIPARRIRRVPPEEEGGYKIKMPSGTTEKTRKILQMQQQISQGGSKRSVFSRLGDSAVSSSTDSTKVSSSVFERLGPSNKSTRDDTPSSTVLNDQTRPKVKGPPLQYRGVLKMTVGKKRTVMASPLSKAITSTRTVIKPGMTRSSNRVGMVRLDPMDDIWHTNTPPNTSVLRTAKSTGTQGIFGHRAMSQGLNVKSRLGDKIEIDAIRLPRTKMPTKFKGPPKVQSNVFARLGQ